jgi:nicotinamidase-related amidase
MVGESGMQDGLVLETAATALILVDLQAGVVRLPMEPLSGKQVVEVAGALADEFRRRGALVILLRAGFSRDRKDLLRAPTDRAPFSGTRGDDWADLMPGLHRTDQDLVITKRQWGAFYGTDLDLQLRRRGIRNVVIGGVATNFGVESTARAAVENGYAVILATDVMSSFTTELHQFAVDHMLPYIGRVRSSAEIVAALSR